MSRECHGRLRKGSLQRELAERYRDDDISRRWYGVSGLNRCVDGLTVACDMKADLTVKK